MEILLAIGITAGVLLLLAGLLGWCLNPRRGRSVTVLLLKGDVPHLERRIRYYLWLMRWGFLPGELLLADCGLSPWGRKQAELWTRESECLHLVSFGDLQTYFEFTRSEHGTGI